MHYLKCTHCGHLNEVNSEYLVFCSNCKKKLDNNFSAWKKTNPSGTLADFQKNVCTTRTESATPTQVKRTKERKALFLLIGFAIGVVFTIASLFTVGLIMTGDKVMALLTPQETSQDLLKAEWSRKTYGSLGLSVELPFELKNKAVPVPPNAKEIIEFIESFDNDRQNGIQVTIGDVQYKPIVGAANLQAGAQMIIESMRSQPGTSNFTYDQSLTERNGIQGVRQSGSYILFGKDFSFITELYTDGLYLWQVGTAWESTNKTGEIVCQKVLNSVKIEKPNE